MEEAATFIWSLYVPAALTYLFVYTYISELSLSSCIYFCCTIVFHFSVCHMFHSHDSVSAGIIAL
jgi:hypothetical protein